MARSAAAAITVLESLRVLYDVGGLQAITDNELLELFEQIGIDGFTVGQAPYFLMAGTVLRLLLRHANADVDMMFDAARRDLDRLSHDIDDAKFAEIIAELDEPQD